MKEKVEVVLNFNGRTRRELVGEYIGDSKRGLWKIKTAAGIVQLRPSGEGWTREMVKL